MSERYSEIIKTSNIDEVNKLCEDGWVLINNVVKDNEVVFYFGKIYDPFSPEALKDFIDEE